MITVSSIFTFQFNDRLNAMLNNFSSPNRLWGYKARRVTEAGDGKFFSKPYSKSAGIKIRRGKIKLTDYLKFLKEQGTIDPEKPILDINLALSLVNESIENQNPLREHGGIIDDDAAKALILRNNLEITTQHR